MYGYQVHGVLVVLLIGAFNYTYISVSLALVLFN